MVFDKIAMKIYFISWHLVDGKLSWTTSKQELKSALSSDSAICLIDIPLEKCKQKVFYSPGNVIWNCLTGKV